MKLENRPLFSMMVREKGLRGCAAILLSVAAVGTPLLMMPSPVSAFALGPIFGVDQNGVQTGFIPSLTIDDAPRWDTTSLSVGLTYNFGEWSATGPTHGTTLSDIADFENKFTWDGTKPSVSDFTSAVNGAFSTWTGAWQPSAGPLAFTKTSNAVGSGISKWSNDFTWDGNNLLGNQIDIFAVPGGVFTGGLTADFGNANDVHLTNGFGFSSIGGLFPSSQILAVDLGLDETTSWTLTMFQSYLAHELGHALGLGDVDNFVNSPSTSFWDTDGNISNVMPINMRGDVRDGLPVTPNIGPLARADAEGKILMCSQCGTLLTSLKNDDLAGIRFLYPVPEPGTLALLGVALAGLGFSRHRKLS